MPFSSGFNGRSALCISDANKKMLFASDGYLNLLGRKQGAVIGRNWQEWVVPDDFTKITPLFENLRATGRAYHKLARLVRGDGRALYVAVNGFVLRGESPEHDCYLGEHVLLDEFNLSPDPARLASADHIQEATYELAADAGQHGLGQLAEHLLKVSGFAEQTMDSLMRAASLPKRETV